MSQWVLLRTLFAHIPLLVKLAFTVLLSGIAAGAIVHVLEPSKFPTWFDGIWWAFVTVSTVGYGDFVPESTTTRLLAILLIFAGVGFMTLLVTSFAGAAVQINQSTREGGVSFLGEGHIIIIGWNERSRHTITTIKEEKPHTKIVLIDETLQELPNAYKGIHFVRGNSSEDAVLKQANIGLASTVLITASHQGNEFTADAFSVLTTLAVKAQNPSVYTIVELLTRDQVVNATRAGADKCISSTQLTGDILTSNVIHPNTSEVISKLFEFERMSLLEIRPIHERMVGKSFVSLLSETYNSGYLPLGIKRGEQMLIHPHATLVIEADDELIIIASQAK
ncbi:potassium channel family protein [Halalkalibacter krulwichiae]|uniref:Voltage-gated potassium channel Kch n=1 Tax=Halalkalibacter krulwichiae TaxID=199441 RepID=A0A1X9MEK8_9BACI|nr:potassium channel protein [Halalkalibacter krulwichiae]ARK31879.1 Voltage-gated potassium channel Kch [Halalkalibacter krulwichiae]